MPRPGLEVTRDDATGRVASVKLYGEELLDASAPCESELWVNGLQLRMRPHVDPNHRGAKLEHLKGERWVDQTAGWALVLAREMGERAGMKHRCFGVQTLVRREIVDLTCPDPGPGGPAIEAPLWVDSLSVLNWNWRFWGDDTRMIFASSHSNGPSHETGHVGYEHDTPEACKKYLKNTWRRLYPGSMVIHGGLFYSARTEHWLAITCRRPQVGYILNIENAGRGVCYDFTLHAHVDIGETIQLPEVKIYFGETRADMMDWLGDYASFYYQEPPRWVFETVWDDGVGWDARPSWSEQADYWIEQIDKGVCSGIKYCLVTNRPVKSGTTPLGYEPDPNHGTKEEFRRAMRRVADRGIPVLIWMSHSGMLYRGGMDIDDDWFIRGIDGRVSASWGSIDGGLMQINPGHPGYIAYTKKWIDFYIGECGARGIFFDCLSWCFPPDFAQRDFMRYPGDTNLMAVRFMDEIYAHVKRIDQSAIVLGEGTSLDFPVDVFSVCANPKRAIDGMGPRDLFLSLNAHSPKRFVIDQGPRLAPASGMCCVDQRPGAEEANRRMTALLRERGGRDAFAHVNGDLSVLDDLLFVPVPEGGDDGGCRVSLPDPWGGVRRLVADDGRSYERDGDGGFGDVPSGVYRMER